MALAALAQDSRLDVFRLLVQAGPDGLAAGTVAARLSLAPNTLSFHFDRLRQAGLVTVKREGRSLIYAAHYEVMNDLLGYLTENCCQGASTQFCAATSPSCSVPAPKIAAKTRPSNAAPRRAKPALPTRARKKELVR